MRAVALNVARAALLAGPTVLAFFTGGYFETQQAVAGLVAWLLVVVALLCSSRPLPSGRDAWLAIGGLGALGAWTLLSITWAPIAGSAYQAGQIVMLYTGALLAAAMLLRGRTVQRTVEPALAAGVLIVIGYGISERLLPGLLHFSRSVTAEGRLEQPLTYWNAMGELAALGFVLCARLCGDSARPRALRILAAGATAPLGLGLYLSFSRGALFACAAGLLALFFVARRREQLLAIGLAIAAGALSSIAAAPFRGVTSLAGALATRERQGAITFVLLAVIVVAAGLAEAWMVRRERPAELRLPRHAGLIATAVICAGLALAIVVGAHEKSGTPITAGAGRFGTLKSDRYAYWDVALRAFASEPLRGVGAGGWAVWWLRDRTINDFAQDAHSLPLQTMAELGVVGLALLAVFLAGIGFSARKAVRAVPALAAGPIAGFVTYIAHAPLDWDWQMPALTLVAIVLGGALLALAQPEAADRRSEPAVVAEPSVAPVA